MSTADLETMLRAAAPPAPDGLRERVRELRVPERRRLPFPSRRVLLAAVPVAAAGIVGAAVVHGFTGLEPSRVAHSPAQGSVAGGGALEGKGATPTTATDTFGPIRSRASAPPVSGGGRLRRYEASLRLRVDGEQSLSRATSRATRMATSLGGYAFSVEYRRPAGSSGQAFLELRVPTARVQDAIPRLSGLGTIVSQHISVQDLERDLERETAQIAQLRRHIHLLREALDDPSLTPVQRVQLRIKLADARRALAARTHAQKTTISEGTLARLSVVVTTAKAAVAAPHHESRLRRMLGSAAGFLALEATIALYVLVVAGPVALLLLLAWAGARVRRRREERRLLAAS